MSDKTRETGKLHKLHPTFRLAPKSEEKFIMGLNSPYLMNDKIICGQDQYVPTRDGVKQEHL